MVRRLLCVFLLVLACGPICAASFPRTVRDARGVAVTLRAKPRRIVSLAPGTTEMLFALGLGDSLVGDTVYCDYPPAARKITKIGDVNVNYEAVLARHPDLVVASDANRAAIGRLTQLGLTVLMIAPTSFSATEASLQLLGQATGQERQAQAVVGQMEAKRRAAAAIAARDPRRPRVLVVVGLDPLWTAGSGTFIGDILTRAGATDAAASVKGYAPYSKEAALAHPPDVILASPSDQAALRADPALQDLPAVRAGRFLNVSSDLISRPGPRLADALLQVARALHPGAK